jgi:hypothetical protein
MGEIKDKKERATTTAAIEGEHDNHFTTDVSYYKYIALQYIAFL